MMIMGRNLKREKREPEMGEDEMRDLRGNLSNVYT